MSLKSLLSSLLLLLLLVSCSSSSEEQVDYRVAIDPSWYPQDFMGQEPALIGFSKDIILEVSKNQGFTVGFISAGPEYLFGGLTSHEWEGSLSSIPPSLDYEGLYRFSDPYLLIGPLLVVPTASPVRNLGDLTGKTICIPKGSEALPILGAEVKDVVILLYNSPSIALEALMRGECDAVALPALIAGAFLRDIYKNELRTITKPLNQEGLRLITLHENTQFIEEFNKGLKEIRDSGEYQKLLDRWQIVG